MNPQTVSTSLSSANQTAVPSTVRQLLELQPGDKLLWRIDPELKQITIKPAPRQWGTYMRGLGKQVWQGEDAQEYVKKLRTDRTF